MKKKLCAFFALSVLASSSFATEEIMELRPDKAAYATFPIPAGLKEGGTLGVEFQAFVEGASGAEAPIVSPELKIVNDNPLKERGFYCGPPSGHYYSLQTGIWTRKSVEALVRPGDKSVRIGFTLKGAASGKVKALRLLPGGFPKDSENGFYHEGAPYVEWAASLKPSKTALAAPSLMSRSGDPENGDEIWTSAAPKLSPENIAQFKEELADYMRLSPEALASLVPEKRPFCWWDKGFPFNGRKPGRDGDGDHFSSYMAWRWTPLKPDELRDEDGKLFDIQKLYPGNGSDEVMGPDGATREYPYHKMTDAEIAKSPCPPVYGDSKLPSSSILSDASGRKAIKAERRKSLWEYKSRAGESGGSVTLTADSMMNAAAPCDEECSFGLSSKTPAELRVNGVLVLKTDGDRTLAPAAHIAAAKLDKLKNSIEVKCADSPDGVSVVLAGPVALRSEFARRKLLPPQGKIYLDSFLTTVRFNCLFKAAYKMALLYFQTGDLECAKRSAAIFKAIAKAIPTWPLYGRSAWDSDTTQKRFWPADRYDWFSFYWPGLNSEWYNGCSGMLGYPLRAFDMLKDAPVWKDGEKEAVAESLLDAERRILSYDAWYRNSDFVLYHNTGGGALVATISAGAVLGSDELLKYGAAKFQGYADKMFLADDVFPESVSYSMLVVAVLGEPSALLRRGATSQPGVEKSIATIERIKKTLFRFGFPDGSLLTVHDTRSRAIDPEPWPSSLRPHPRDEADSVLFPEFGHGILAAGKGDGQVEAHLHFSGEFNHGHEDFLNLALWAYGDELVPDLGYGISQFKNSSIVHNLVMVDGGTQRASSRGNTLFWEPPKDGLPGAIMAGQGVDKAYPECESYERCLALIPFGEGRDAVVDFFHVKGGASHEWLANGCADYPQDVDTGIEFSKKLDNLAPDGKAVERPDGLSDSYGSRSAFYGAFRNARIAPETKPWTMTMKAKAPGRFDYPGAGPRAKSDAPKAALKLHWPCPEGGETILCESPRDRYLDQGKKHIEALAAWSSQRMPKIIVRRKSAGGDDVFAAVWEPFKTAPFIKNVEAVPLTEPSAKALKTECLDGQSALVVFNPLRKKLSVDGISFDAVLMVSTDSKTGGRNVKLFGGDPAASFKVKALERDEKGFSLRCEAEKTLSSDETASLNSKYAGALLRLTSTLPDSRLLAVESIEGGDGKNLKIRLEKDPGFKLDVERGLLSETCFPLRTLRCGDFKALLP
jgi:hypothetical protein